jgi:hypothetical protein
VAAGAPTAVEAATAARRTRYRETPTRRTHTF